MGKPLPPGVEIRPATDEAAVDAARGLFRTYKAEMRQDLCFQAYEAEVQGLPGEYAPPGGALLLAWKDGRPLACVALHGIRSERPGRRLCEMKRLYALPEARGLGLGRALAERIIEEARRIGYDAMRLDTLPMMREAIGLYATMGFREIHAYRHNPVPGVLFLELDLAPTPSGGGEALRIEVEDASGALSAAALAWLREKAALAGAELARRLGAAGEARVRVVGDAEMTRVHEARTGETGTTDVLTFDLSEVGRVGEEKPEAKPVALTSVLSHEARERRPEGMDADILVCADEARRAARGGERGVERELLLYAVHGALHCLGFDDHDEAAYAKMHETEDAVLAAIGVGRVFGGEEGAEAHSPGDAAGKHVG